MTYSLNSKPSILILLLLLALKLLLGQAPPSSTSIEIINGKGYPAAKRFLHLYSGSHRCGKITLIPPAEAMVGKVTYQSNPVSIEVIKASSGSARQANQPQPTQPQQIAAGEENLPDDLFVTIELNRKTAYMGEPVEAAIKIYTASTFWVLRMLNFPLSMGSGVRSWNLPPTCNLSEPM